jgi:hypothetical protein
MKLLFFRNNIDSFVIAKKSLKTRIKLIVKFFENISSSFIFAISSLSQNSSQKSVRKWIKKSIKKSIKQSVKQSIKQSVKQLIKQLIKQSIKSVKKSIRTTFIFSLNINYFVLLKISNNDNIDNNLLIDDEVKKTAKWLVKKKT